ncbi:(2Fe-2S)-binding protein [Dyadobacter sp. CY261]|uniref:(2Fe-2S)-binding protein n=1 Tax=Dyadobacter sp. CY261 TaxID=2907203 RepID=UPI001F327037|nr:(2Fe-2S)-binding protein [Dyadobacter sp. CY261]MCF0074326.1 (2Fe-2S)-binding protein [Dyadobacter sp. CY261]
MANDQTNASPDASNEDRRFFLKQSIAIAGLSAVPTGLLQAALEPDDGPVGNAVKIQLSLTINGKRKRISVDPRMSLLDLLRENLGLTGIKKGCDFGQCGACTVHIDGRRTLSCLTFAVMQHGRKVTTIEGLSHGGQLHPLQEAFIKHDGFQCGYCTPGQLMSGIACIREGYADSPDEVREYMSGNLCRCGAYPNIVDAILEVKKEGLKV